MRDPAHLPLDGGDDVGVGMAEHRAHLAGGEVENAAPVGVIDEAPLRPLDDDGFEAGPIAREMRVGGGPEGGIGIQRHGSSPYGGG